MHIVRPTPQRDVVDRGAPADSVWFEMVELQVPERGTAASVSGSKRTAIRVAAYDFASHAGRDVARIAGVGVGLADFGAGVFCPGAIRHAAVSPAAIAPALLPTRSIRRRELFSTEFPHEKFQRHLQDHRRISVRNLVSQEFLRCQEIGVHLLVGRELNPVAFRGQGEQGGGFRGHRGHRGRCGRRTDRILDSAHLQQV